MGGGMRPVNELALQGYQALNVIVAASAINARFNSPKKPFYPETPARGVGVGEHNDARLVAEASGMNLHLNVTKGDLLFNWKKDLEEYKFKRSSDISVPVVSSLAALKRFDQTKDPAMDADLARSEAQVHGHQIQFQGLCIAPDADADSTKRLMSLIHGNATVVNSGPGNIATSQLVAVRVPTPQELLTNDTMTPKHPKLMTVAIKPEEIDLHYMDMFRDRFDWHFKNVPLAEAQDMSKLRLGRIVLADPAVVAAVAARDEVVGHKAMKRAIKPYVNRCSGYDVAVVSIMLALGGDGADLTDMVGNKAAFETRYKFISRWVLHPVRMAVSQSHQLIIGRAQTTALPGGEFTLHMFGQHM